MGVTEAVLVGVVCVLIFAMVWGAYRLGIEQGFGKGEDRLLTHDNLDPNLGQFLTIEEVLRILEEEADGLRHGSLYVTVVRGKIRRLEDQFDVACDIIKGLRSRLDKLKEKEREENHE